MATPATRFQLLILAATAADAEGILALLKRAKLPVRGAFSQNPKSLIRAQHSDLILACIGGTVEARALATTYAEIEQRIPLFIIAPPGDLDTDALHLLRGGASGLLTPGDDTALVQRIRRQVKTWHLLRQGEVLLDRLKRSEQLLQALLKAKGGERSADRPADTSSIPPEPIAATLTSATANTQDNLMDLLSPEYREAIGPLLREQQAPDSIAPPDQPAPMAKIALSPPSPPLAPFPTPTMGAELPPLTLAISEEPLPALPERPQALSGQDPSDEELIEQIERALDNDGFKLAYQPLVSLRGDSQEKYSVLLRLLDDNRSYRAADNLLEPAERSGRMPEVDRWVIQHAMSVLSTRRQAGQRAHFFLSLSAALLGEPDVLVWIYDQLRQHSIRGNWVSFQIKEADARHNPDVALSLASGLKHIKSSLTLSHFGLNTDSELLLNDLPAEFIKLGSELTQGLSEDSLKQARVKHLFDIARERQIRGIAGWVEDERTLARVWTSGADYVQGKLLGRPSSVFELHD